MEWIPELGLEFVLRLDGFAWVLATLVTGIGLLVVTSGTLVHRYVPEPIAVRPLGSVEAFVPAEDTRGGTGANFVVEWAAEQPMPTPLIEAVMIGVTGTQGYSFVSRGISATTAR
jgi:hypothetical protein